MSAQIVTIISVLLGGGFIGALIQVYRAKPDRDSVVVTAGQNAGEIYKGLNEALYTDFQRERDGRREWQRYAAELEELLTTNKIDYPVEKRP
jgi:hypothetical protein